LKIKQDGFLDKDKTMDNVQVKIKFILPITHVGAVALLMSFPVLSGKYLIC
jgi:hypothetical protein